MYQPHSEGMSKALALLHLYPGEVKLLIKLLKKKKSSTRLISLRI